MKYVMRQNRDGAVELIDRSPAKPTAVTCRIVLPLGRQGRRHGGGRLHHLVGERQQDGLELGVGLDRGAMDATMACFP